MIFFDYGYFWYRDIYDSMGKPVLVKYIEDTEQYLVYFIGRNIPMDLDLLLPGYFVYLYGVFDD